MRSLKRVEKNIVFCFCFFLFQINQKNSYYTDLISPQQSSHVLHLVQVVVAVVAVAADVVGALQVVRGVGEQSRCERRRNLVCQREMWMGLLM